MDNGLSNTIWPTDLQSRGVVCAMSSLLEQCHLHTSVLLTALTWPITCTLVLQMYKGTDTVKAQLTARTVSFTHNATLLEISHHDNDGSVVVNDHSPEIFHSALQRSLSGNVLTCSPLIALMIR